MPEASGRQRHYWNEHEPTFTVDEDPPVLNEWYPLLPETEDVELIFLTARQIHDAAAALNLQIRVIADGTTYTGTFAANDSTWYFAVRYPHDDILGTFTSWQTATFYGHWKAQLMQIDIRQTGAIGVNQQLDGRCVYEINRIT